MKDITNSVNHHLINMNKNSQVVDIIKKTSVIDKNIIQNIKYIEDSSNEWKNKKIKNNCKCVKSLTYNESYCLECNKLLIKEINNEIKNKENINNINNSNKKTTNECSMSNRSAYESVEESELNENNESSNHYIRILVSALRESIKHNEKLELKNNDLEDEIKILKEEIKENYEVIEELSKLYLKK